MKSAREQQQNIFKIRKGAESPQLQQERPSLVSQFQQFSPIQSNNYIGQGSQIDSARSKQFTTLTHKFQNNDDDQLDTPNVLIREFYQNPKALQNFVEDFDLNEEVHHIETVSKGKTQNQKQAASTKNHAQDANCNEKHEFGIVTSEQAQHRIGKIKKGEQQYFQERRNGESPLQQVKPLASGNQKWAFQNQDNQVLKSSDSKNGTLNTQDLISKSLKSYDHKNQYLPTNSSQNPGSIKGKALDFGKINVELESALLQNKNKNFIKPNVTEESKQEVISLLTESDLLSTHNKQTVEQYLMKEKKQNAKLQSQMMFPIPKQMQYLQEMADTTIDCCFCHPQKYFDESLNCSNIEETKTRLQVIQENLEKKYLTSREYYNVKIINDIIYNENTHIVSVFKDYLIFDDVSEFLKRTYNKGECIQRLPKMYEFYEKFAKVFPNYVNIPENKYMFKNIERKQRILDEKQKYMQDQQEKQLKKKDQGTELGNSSSKNKNKHKDRFSSQSHPHSQEVSQLSNNKLFDTKFIDSVANIHATGFIDSMQSSRILNSQYQDHQQNSSILIHQTLKQNMDNAKQKRNKNRGIHELDLDELISKFIAKDSESNIQQSIIYPDGKDISQDNKYENKQKQNVYEYQEKAPQTVQKVLTQNLTSKPPSDKRISSGTNSSVKQNVSRQKQEETKGSNQRGSIDHQAVQVNKDGKILSYNIYNNYNQYISNENYYISNEGEKQKDHQIQILNQDSQAKQSKSNSLSRTQSKANLHFKYQDIPGPLNTAQTPSKLEESKLITPNNGSFLNISNKDMNNKQNQHKLASRVKKNQESSQNKNDEHLIKQMTSGNNSQVRNTQEILGKNTSPVGGFLQNKTLFTNAKTSIASNGAMTTRDPSREKLHQKNIIPSVKLQQNSLLNNQIFKTNSLNQPSQTQSIQQNKLQHNPSQKILSNLDKQLMYPQAHSSNVRSVERLQLIEEEIEKDYSKYINEFGLTKTAFAKAVNALREKNIQSQLNINSQQQHAQTTKSSQQFSGEKIKRSSLGPQTATNLQRTGSNSQKRQTNQNRPPSILKEHDYIQTGNTVLRNDYQQTIRSVKAQNYLSSQNSSNYVQKSQKISPERNFLLANQNYPQQMTSLQNNSQNVTSYLKAQPTKGTKQIKIKFPLNPNQQIQQQNSTQAMSSNQTPTKRIKLTKTKSVSSIPIQMMKGQVANNIEQSSNHLTHQQKHNSRGRLTPQDILLLEDASQNNPHTASFVPTSTVLKSIPSQALFSQKLLHQFCNDQNQTDIPLQNTFASTVQGMTYQSSVLNSPQSFNNVNNNPLKQTQAKDTSRNANTSNQQHTQKSQGAGHHQRAISALVQGVNHGSHSKKKKNNESSKRMSSGNNLSKAAANQAQSTTTLLQHQPQNANIQKQIIQLLMSYQNQDDLGQNLGVTQSVKNLTQSSGLQQTALIKDLKNVRQVTTSLLKDQQTIRSTKASVIPQQNLYQQPNKQSFALIQSTNNTTSISGAHQRPQTAQGQANSILMGKFTQKKTSASKGNGKTTERAETTKKRQSMQGGSTAGVLPPNALQYQINGDGQVSMAHHQNINSYTYANQQSFNPDQTSEQYISRSQNDQKKLLAYSKSQENLELIKMAAQRAAEQQYNQQQQEMNQNNQTQSNKYLQKQQDSQQYQQFFMQKVRLSTGVPTIGLQYNQGNGAALQSARNHYNESGLTGPGSQIMISQDFDNRDQQYSLGGNKTPSLGLQQQKIPSSRRASEKQTSNGMAQFKY